MQPGQGRGGVEQGETQHPVLVLGDDEQVGDRRGDEQHEQPRGQGPREAPGVGPSGSEEEREEPRREHVDEREGDDADQDRPLDGDPHQWPHLTGLDRGELLEEDLGHRAVDEDERCVQVAPGHLELPQRGGRVARDEQLDAVEAQGVRQGVGAIEQRHAPVAAGHPPQRRRLLGQRAPQLLGLASQISEGEDLAGGEAQHQAGHTPHSREAEADLANVDADLLLSLVDGDGAVVAGAVEPELEQLHPRHEEGGQTHQGHPQGDLMPPPPGDQTVQGKSRHRRQQRDDSDAHHSQAGHTQGLGLLLGEHDRHVVAQCRHRDEDSRDRGVDRHQSHVARRVDARQHDRHAEADHLGHSRPGDEGQHVPQQRRGLQKRRHAPANPPDQAA